MHSELARLLFLQAHRETTQYFEAQGQQLAQNNHLDTFHYKRAAFYNGLKSKVGLVLAKAAALRINLNLDCIPIPSPAYTHPTHRTRTHQLHCTLPSHSPPPRLEALSVREAVQHQL